MEWHQNTFLPARSTASGHRKKYKLRQRQTRYEKRVKRNEIVWDRQTAEPRGATDCRAVVCAQREEKRTSAALLGAGYRVLFTVCQASSFDDDANRSNDAHCGFCSGSGGGIGSLNGGGGVVCVGCPAGGATLGISGGGGVSGPNFGVKNWLS